MEELVIIITNPNHHWLNAKPIIEYALSQKRKVKLLSFCKLRRLASPSDRILNKVIYKEWGSFISEKENKILLNKVVLKERKRKKILQKLIYRFSLLPFLKKNVSKSSRVLIFNDAAYPMNFFCYYFNKHQIKYYLLQEGIRFPLPNVKEDISYGASGAKIIFSWGEEPKEHFLKISKRNTTQVLVSGAPRYLNIQEEYKGILTEDNLLGIFTNPIDQLGFCTLEEKTSIFNRFIASIKGWVMENEVTLLLKIHPGEKWSTYEVTLNELNIPYRRAPKDIFKAINQVKAGVIMASTVGLELLLFKKNIAQLPVPDNKYIFDYVENEVALPIDINHFDLFKWKTWWELKTLNQNRDAFLENYLSLNHNTVEKIYHSIF